MSIAELRQRFEVAHASKLQTDFYHHKDVVRFKSDDAYAEAFLLHNQMNLEAAVKQIDACFSWRKQQNICAFEASRSPSEIHKLGSIYWHSKDKGGHRILYLILKDAPLRRDASLVTLMNQFIVWQLEQENQRNPARKIVVLFSMPDVVNVDVDLVKFVIACFTTYFPNFLAYALVYELPAGLNDVWKVVKGWLDENAQKRVVFVTKHDIENYIEASCLCMHMGGRTDDFQFNQPPALTEDANVNIIKVANSGTPIDECYLTRRIVDSANQGLRQRNKRVSFNETFSDSFSSTLAGTDSVDRNGILRSNSLNIASQRRESGHAARYISISPTDQLEFSLLAGNVDIEIENCISLTNQTSLPVAFKVKTTSPEDYRVKPSCGLIQVDATVQIQVAFKQARLSTTNCERCDKFQILALPVPADITCEKAVQMIKSATRENLQEHRLLCQLLLPSEKSCKSQSSTELEEVTLTEMHRLVASMACRLDAVEVVMKSSLNYLRLVFWLCAAATLLIAFLFWRLLF